MANLEDWSRIFLAHTLNPKPYRYMSLSSPHQVTECVCILKRVPDVSWKGAKGMMADSSFLKSLVEFEKDAITEKQVV